ncbi:MAG TPA: hypothetical protein DGT23_15905 [Micromonosporaceae bacterium]|nr:hypothetical protein [Micromonosporaceae bacterium]
MAKHRGGKGGKKAGGAAAKGVMKPLKNVLKDGKKVDDVTPDPPTPRKGIPSYKPAPSSIPGIPGLRRARPKTSVQGGGGLRKRWTDKDGNIYEWDSQHGALEKYDKRGKHQGEFNPETGGQNKGPDSTRSVDP